MGGGLAANRSKRLAGSLAPEGAKVFETEWDDTVVLLHFNDRQRYLVALDPHYMFHHTPRGRAPGETFRLWSGVIEGRKRVVDPGQERERDWVAVVREDFQTAYLICLQERDVLLANLRGAPDVVETYSAFGLSVFDVRGGRAKAGRAARPVVRLRERVPSGRGRGDNRNDQPDGAWCLCSIARRNRKVASALGVELGPSSDSGSEKRPRTRPWRSSPPQRVSGAPRASRVPPRPSSACYDGGGVSPPQRAGPRRVPVACAVPVGGVVARRWVLKDGRGSVRLPFGPLQQSEIK